MAPVRNACFASAKRTLARDSSQYCIACARALAPAPRTARLRRSSSARTRIPFTQQHIVVTGGCGFFGAWIIKKLIEAGDAVTAFDVALNTKKWEMLLTAEEIARVRFVAGRVDADDFVDTLVGAAPDAVIHLAGLQVPTCRENPVLGAKVNVIGTLHIFEAAKRIKASGRAPPAIVYASSAAIFGADADYGEQAVGDMSTPKPSSHYGAYKLCTEHAAKAYWVANQVPSVGLRPLTVYGPGRDMGLTSFPTRSVAAAIKGQPFEITFSGDTVYTYIEEVADIFVQCAKRAVADAKVCVGGRARAPARPPPSSPPRPARPAPRYTIGGDTVSSATFVAELAKLVPAAAQLVTVSGASLPFPSHLDDVALRADYPGLMRVGIADGIARTVAMYQALEAKGALTV